MKVLFNMCAEFIHSSRILFILFLCASTFFANGQVKKKQSKPTVKQQPKPSPALPEPTFIVSYEVLENGDTINKLDNKNNKQGKWLITHEAHYDESAYMEWGTFDNNKKQGKWLTYAMNGTIQAMENYKQDNKDGEVRYFDEGDLYCVGHYLALRSLYDYDTIMVEDAVTNLEKPVIIKANRGSVRHGFWTYYEPHSSEIAKVVEYQADDIIYEREFLSKADSTYIEARLKVLPHVSNKNTNGVWQLHKNKKPIRYTDFPDNIEYVKPNVRRK